MIEQVGRSAPSRVDFPVMVPRVLSWGKIMKGTRFWQELKKLNGGEPEILYLNRQFDRQISRLNHSGLVLLSVERPLAHGLTGHLMIVDRAANLKYDYENKDLLSGNSLFSDHLFMFYAIEDPGRQVIHLKKIAFKGKGPEGESLRGRGFGRELFTRIHAALRQKFAGWRVVAVPVHPASERLMLDYSPRYVESKDIDQIIGGENGSPEYMCGALVGLIKP